MTTIEQVIAKTMGPIKNSLLAFAVGIAPGILTRESEKALQKATEQIAQNIGEETAKNLENMLENFGPEKSPDTESPQPENKKPPSDQPEGENFPEETKNGILPDKTIPPTTEVPQAPGTAAPAEVPKTEQPKPTEETDQGKMAPQGEHDPNNPDKPQQALEGEDTDHLTAEEQEERQKEAELRKQQEALSPPKGTVTQTANNLWYGPEIRRLERLKKSKEKGIKNIKKIRKSLQLKKIPLQVQKFILVPAEKLSHALLWILTLFMGCFSCCSFGCLIPVAGAIGMIRTLVSAFHTLVKTALSTIEKKLEGIQEQINHIDKRLKQIQQEIRQIDIDIYKKRNQGLIAGIGTDIVRSVRGSRSQKK